MALLRLIVLGMGLICSLSHAISGSEQVRLAGEGLYDELAERLAAENEGPQMSTADRHALCFAYSKLKDYSHLQGCLDQLAKRIEGPDRRTRLFGLDDARPTVFLMRGEAAIDVGDVALARESAGNAVDWFHREHSADRDILVNALALKVMAEALAARRPQAEQNYEQLKAVDVSWPRYDAYANAKRTAIARAAMALARWPDVLQALAPNRTEGFHIFMDDLLSGAAARGRSNWVWQELPRAYMVARATLETDRAEDATAAYDRLLAVPEIGLNAEVLWLALFDRGRLAEQAGRDAQAIDLYRRSVEAIERQRASISTEASKIGFVGQRQSVYERLIRLLLRQRDTGAAYEYVERSKSRALVDMLATRMQSVSAVGAEAGEGDALGRFLDRERELKRQSPLSLAGAGAGSRHVALQEATEQLRRSAPQLASLVAVDRLSAAQLQALVDPDELLLQYYLNGDEGSVFAVSREGLKVFPFDGAGLEKTVRGLREAMQSQVEGVMSLHRSLYDLLLAQPLRSAPQKKLLIVPHGPLHYLSFAALHDGNGYLIDRFALRTLPIATVLRYLAERRTAAGAGMLLLGNPDLHNPDHDLPNAQLEVEALARGEPSASLLVRGAASETAFVAAAGRYRWVHVASHGIFDQQQPLDSALMLAADATNDGKLTAAELYRLRLNADLVTLSACETGVGRSLSGDEIVGLTRGFLYAGASNIVASLWNVDDFATSLLMQQFYAQLRKGQDKREALRRAQIETRKKFPHPFFWAPFFLVGRG